MHRPCSDGRAALSVFAVDFLRPAAAAAAAVKIDLVPREKGDANVPAMNKLFDAARAVGTSLGMSGSTDREKELGPVAEAWAADATAAGVVIVDSTRGLELFLAVKDEDAMGQVRGGRAGDWMRCLSGTAHVLRDDRYCDCDDCNVPPASTPAVIDCRSARLVTSLRALCATSSSSTWRRSSTRRTPRR